MKSEGPSLELLLRRVTETPAEFLAEPQTQARPGGVQVPAVVADLMTAYGHAIGSMAEFQPDDSVAARRQAAVVLLLCWLLAEPELVGTRPVAAQLGALLREGAVSLAGASTAEKYVADPDRREELVRFALAQLDLRPRGETVNQATDRLTALSSVERARVIKAARLAEQRAREIRESLARKAAQESADKYTRE